MSRPELQMCLLTSLPWRANVVSAIANMTANPVAPSKVHWLAARLILTDLRDGTSWQRRNAFNASSLAERKTADKSLHKVIKAIQQKSRK
jgi:hypothetical protein